MVNVSCHVGSSKARLLRNLAVVTAVNLLQILSTCDSRNQHRLQNIHRTLVERIDGRLKKDAIATREN
jgi:hypothetical protein